MEKIHGGDLVELTIPEEITLTEKINTGQHRKLADREGYALGKKPTPAQIAKREDFLKPLRVPALNIPVTDGNISKLLRITFDRDVTTVPAGMLAVQLYPAIGGEEVEGKVGVFGKALL